MAWAQEMKNLAAEIKTGHKDRTTRIGEIKGETKDILSDADAYMKKVAADLKEAAKDLRDFLAKSEGTRKKDFEVMMGEIQAKIKEIKGDVKSLLSKSETERMEAFKTMMNDISKDIKAIKGRVDDLKKEVRGTIGAYAQERKEAAGYWGRVGGRAAAEETAPAEKAAPKQKGRKRGRRKK